MRCQFNKRILQALENIKRACKYDFRPIGECGPTKTAAVMDLGEHFTNKKNCPNCGSTAFEVANIAGPYEMVRCANCQARFNIAWAGDMILHAHRMDAN